MIVEVRSDEVEKRTRTDSRPVDSGHNVKEIEKDSGSRSGDGQPAIMEGVLRNVVMASSGRIVPDKSGTQSKFTVFQAKYSAAVNRPEDFSEVHCPASFTIRWH